jgi:hypothetical protein
LVKNKVKVTVMKTFFIFLMLSITSAAFGQASISWIQNTPGVSIALDNSNNVFTVRSDNTPGGDIYLTKRDLNGVLLWERRYDQTDPTKFDKAVCVDIDPSGNAIVAGNLTSFSSTTGPGTGLIMKFDSGGNLLWRVVFTSSAELMQLSKCVTDAAGNVYLLGKSISNLTVINSQVRKLTPGGAIAWTYTNMEIGSPVNFKLSPDNCILVSGRTGNTGPNGFVKISSLGNAIWSMRIMNTTASGDAAGDINGNTYLVNRETITAVPGSTVRKIDPAGNQLWQRSFSFYSQKIETGNDGLPVAAGSPMTNTSGTAMVKFDAGGNQLWLNADADGANNFIQHVQMGIDQQNNAYVAGSNTANNMAVCRVNSNGSSAWSISVPGTGMAGFDIGSDNCIYVTGSVTAKIRQSLQCPIPQNLFTSNITATSAKLNWDLVPGALRYEILYGSMITPSVSRVWERRIVPGDVNYLVLSGLKCNTPYQWRMRAICDTLMPAVNTGFSVSITFRTASCTNVSDQFNNNGNETVESESLVNDNTAPESIYLMSNYPNPFNPSTVIQYGLNEDAQVSVVVFNYLGQKVATLVNSFMNKGHYTVTWNGTNDDGVIQSSGIYFCRMITGNFVDVRKMVLSR